MLRNFTMSFDNFRIVKLAFVANEGFKVKKLAQINTQISLARKYNKRKKVLAIRLKIASTEGILPFFFEVEGEGKFTFRGTPNEEAIKNFSAINCPAIILPYIRETIADMTRRAGYPPLHLAPINFLKLAEKSKK